MSLLEIKAKRTLFGVSMALEHETRLLETLAKRHRAEKPLMIRAESKLLVGRPLMFLYDAAEGHRLSDYRELARARNRCACLSSSGWITRSTVAA